MNRHLFREIEAIKDDLLRISALVEENLFKSVKALTSRDVALAEGVVKSDQQIDRMEVELEEECLKVLALHQPVAADLRILISVLKINNDLERIGDLAVNVARQARILALRPPLAIPDDISVMARKVQTMLKRALDSLINLDTDKAQIVRDADSEVDRLHANTFGYVENNVRDNPERVGDLLYLVGISRYLERIADHATNIAEDVMYMVEGEISRHSTGPQH